MVLPPDFGNPDEFSSGFMSKKVSVQPMAERERFRRTISLDPNGPGTTLLTIQ